MKVFRRCKLLHITCQILFVTRQQAFNILQSSDFLVIENAWDDNFIIIDNLLKLCMNCGNTSLKRFPNICPYISLVLKNVQKITRTKHYEQLPSVHLIFSQRISNFDILYLDWQLIFINLY